MNKMFDPNGTLIVFLTKCEMEKSTEKRFSIYKIFQLPQVDESRQTILSSILEYSQALMHDLKRDYMNIILIDPAMSYSKNYVELSCEALDQFQFITANGFVHSGKMGFVYNSGALHTSNICAGTSIGEQNRGLDIPVLSVSAFRHYSGDVSKFENYDNWNKEKYLDLELALFSKEKNDQFYLVKNDQKPNTDINESGSVNKVHKAAIYNELFVKNTFDVKAVHYSKKSHCKPFRQSLHSNLELLRSIDFELNQSTRVLLA